MDEQGADAGHGRAHTDARPAACRRWREHASPVLPTDATGTGRCALPPVTGKGLGGPRRRGGIVRPGTVKREAGAPGRPRLTRQLIHRARSADARGRPLLEHRSGERRAGQGTRGHGHRRSIAFVRRRGRRRRGRSRGRVHCLHRPGCHRRGPGVGGDRCAVHGRGRGRGLGSRRRRHPGRSAATGRQQELGIDVAVLVGANPDPEVHVAAVVLRRSAVPRQPDGRAFDDRVAPADLDRAEVEKRDRIAVHGLDRDGTPPSGDGAREGHDAGGRSLYLPPVGGGDVDASMLASEVRIISEHEWCEHRPIDWPCPGAGGHGAGQGHDDDREQDRETSHGVAPRCLM